LQAEVSCWHAPAEQVSTLQARPSSQLSGVPEHEPAKQVSLVVHALLSLHERALLE
jgi:hypothetical protein